MVALGRVREVDRIGNNEADAAAAALGRRRVHHSVSFARGVVTRSCARWYPVVRDLHRFFMAIARSVVNDDGESATSLHPVIWSNNSNPKRRRIHPGGGNFARLPGPVSLWTSDWYRLPVARIDDDDDVSSWPFSVGLLLKIVHVLGCLHWPRGADDLGICGVSYLELLILYERWAGERLVVESAVPFARRVGRPISVSAVPVGPGIDIGRSCRFLGSLFRFLALLPGGLIRFVPCHIGANHCRLRHSGWEKCGHGLTSRPQETSHPGFLDSLLAVFGYPVGSGGLLLSVGFVLVILPSVGLVGVCLILVEFRLYCLRVVLISVLLSFRLLRVGLIREVAGLKELEGLGRECDLPRKRPFRWFVGMVLPMFFTVLGGRGFVLMMRFRVLGLTVIKGDVFHCMSTVFLPREGVG